MRILIVFVAAVIAAGVLFVVFRLHLSPSLVVKSQGPTIERLERLSHLVTTRVYVADVLIGEGEGCRGAWLIRGDALVAVNLGRAKILEKDAEARTATIGFPLPEVLQARVDHERTKTWEVKTTTWIPWRADQDKLRDAVMQEAQKLVGRAAASAENVQAAKQAAETLVNTFYGEVGWHVTVTWEGPPAEGKQGNSRARPSLEVAVSKTP